MEPAPLILTARFAPEAAARFQRLRDAHFPPDRNIVPAHCTLFHHLPGPERDAIARDLARLAGQTSPLPVAVAGPYSLGKGVAYRLRAPELEAVRADLAEWWRHWLIPQDRQGWRPHVTVQNKVGPAEARALLIQLEAAPPMPAFTAVGLTLWRYDNGPWTHLADVAFRGR